MTIPNGRYTIYNVNVKSFVGRYPIEDRSLLPKRVLALNQSIERPIWEIKTSNGKTTLSTRGAPAATEDGHIFAVLLDFPEPDAVELIPTDTPNEYNIRSSGGHWALSGGGDDSDEQNQIQVRLTKEVMQVWRIEPANGGY